MSMWLAPLPLTNPTEADPPRRAGRGAVLCAVLVLVFGAIVLENSPAESPGADVVFESSTVTNNMLEELRQKVEADAKAHGLTIMVGVAGRNGLRASVAAGMRGGEGSQPAKATDPVAWGSVVKLFTGAGILQAFEHGWIRSLDDPVAPYASKEFFNAIGKPMNEVLGPEASNITLRQALMHTTGLRDCPMAINAESTASCFESLSRTKNHGFACKPGECAFYSDANFALLAFVLLEFSGKDVPSVSDMIPATIPHFLLPQLTSIHICAHNQTYSSTNVPFEAKVFVGKDNDVRTNLQDVRCDECLGAGGMVATAADIAFFTQELFDARGKILTPAMRELYDDSCCSKLHDDFGENTLGAFLMGYTPEAGLQLGGYGMSPGFVTGTSHFPSHGFSIAIGILWTHDADDMRSMIAGDQKTASSEQPNNLEVVEKAGPLLDSYSSLFKSVAGNRVDGRYYFHQYVHDKGIADVVS